MRYPPVFIPKAPLRSVIRLANAVAFVPHPRTEAKLRKVTCIDAETYRNALAVLSEAGLATVSGGNVGKHKMALGELLSGLSAGDLDTVAAPFRRLAAYQALVTLIGQRDVLLSDLPESGEVPFDLAMDVGDFRCLVDYVCLLGDAWLDGDNVRPGDARLATPYLRGAFDRVYAAVAVDGRAPAGAILRKLCRETSMSPWAVQRAFADKRLPGLPGAYALIPGGKAIGTSVQVLGRDVSTSMTLGVSLTRIFVDNAHMLAVERRAGHVPDPQVVPAFLRDGPGEAGVAGLPPNLSLSWRGGAHAVPARPGPGVPAREDAPASSAPKVEGGSGPAEASGGDAPGRLDANDAAGEPTACDFPPPPDLDDVFFPFYPLEPAEPRGLPDSAGAVIVKGRQRLRPDAVGTCPRETVSMRFADPAMPFVPGLACQDGVVSLPWGWSPESVDGHLVGVVDERNRRRIDVGTDGTATLLPRYTVAPTPAGGRPGIPLPFDRGCAVLLDAGRPRIAGPPYDSFTAGDADAALAVLMAWVDLNIPGWNDPVASWRHALPRTLPPGGTAFGEPSSEGVVLLQDGETVPGLERIGFRRVARVPCREGYVAFALPVGWACAGGDWELVDTGGRPRSGSDGRGRFELTTRYRLVPVTAGSPGAERLGIGKGRECMAWMDGGQVVATSFEYREGDRISRGAAEAEMVEDHVMGHLDYADPHAYWTERT